MVGAICILSDHRASSKNFDCACGNMRRRYCRQYRQPVLSARMFFGNNLEWLKFLAATGAILLTFLAGAELDPKVIRLKWKEVVVVGMVGFYCSVFRLRCFCPFHSPLGHQSKLVGGHCSFNYSMAVVYAVMLETGFNKTEFGKGY